MLIRFLKSRKYRLLNFFVLTSIYIYSDIHDFPWPWIYGSGFVIAVAWDLVRFYKSEKK